MFHVYIFIQDYMYVYKSAIFAQEKVSVMLLTIFCCCMYLYACYLYIRHVFFCWERYFMVSLNVLCYFLINKKQIWIYIWYLQYEYIYIYICVYFGRQFSLIHIYYSETFAISFSSFHTIILVRYWRSPSFLFGKILPFASTLHSCQSI